MTAIKGKWKALLVLNYICSAIWLLLLFTFFWMYYRANQGGPEVKSNIPYFAIGLFLLLVINILFIYTIKTHLPTRDLSGRVKFLYVAGLIFVGLVVLFLLMISVFQIVMLLSKKYSISKDAFVTIFLIALSIVYILIFIWQVQLMKLLKRNSENELKSVLNSIGIDENNNGE